MLGNGSFASGGYGIDVSGEWIFTFALRDRVVLTREKSASGEIIKLAFGKRVLGLADYYRAFSFNISQSFYIAFHHSKPRKVFNLS